MARDGLIKNSEWALPAAAEGATFFRDPDLHLPAQFLAVLNRFAIDYIRQAPALVVAATYGKRLVYRNDRLEVGKRFIAACERGLRLAALMQSYGLAPQLRALSGKAIRHNQWDLLKALSTIPASALAQSIPTLPGEQQEWLQCLERWRSHMGRHFHNRDLFLAWAAANVRDGQARRSATDIADFAGHNRTTFNTRWNFRQAQAASQRWHIELARRPFAAASNRVDWTELIDYAPLPSQLEIDGFTFHALQTREAIWDEGARMHHCVRLYADKVAKGSSRIYSVRQAGQRVATLELARTTRTGSAPHKYVLAQLKGPRNSQPSAPTATAVAAFVTQVNQGPRVVDTAPRNAVTLGHAHDGTATYLRGEPYTGHSERGQTRRV